MQTLQAQIQEEIAIAHKIEATYISLRQGESISPLPDLSLEELTKASRIAAKGFIGEDGRAVGVHTLDTRQLALLYAINLHGGCLSLTLQNLAIFMPENQTAKP